MYRAVLGEVESNKCGSQGIAGRLYCDFNIPADYLKTTKDLKIFVNRCTPPIYVIDKVSIFEKVTSSGNQCTGCADSGYGYQL